MDSIEDRCRTIPAKRERTLKARVIAFSRGTCSQPTVAGDDDNRWRVTELPIQDRLDPWAHKSQVLAANQDSIDSRPTIGGWQLPI